MRPHKFAVLAAIIPLLLLVFAGFIAAFLNPPDAVTAPNETAIPTSVLSGMLGVVAPPHR